VRWGLLFFLSKALSYQAVPAGQISSVSGVANLCKSELCAVWATSPSPPLVFVQLAHFILSLRRTYRVQGCPVSRYQISVSLGFCQQGWLPLACTRHRLSPFGLAVIASGTDGTLILKRALPWWPTTKPFIVGSMTLWRRRTEVPLVKLVRGYRRWPTDWTLKSMQGRKLTISDQLGARHCPGAPVQLIDWDA